MTFDDFIAKWTGKPCDFDGVYGNQCMDLMHQYIYDVLGVTDAKVLMKDCAKNVYLDFDNTFGHEMFDKIDNTPDGVPNKGDIMFWRSGQYGHVSMFVSGDANNFQSFDQNWPTGSLPHIQDHTYGYVAGWLRFKAAPDIQGDLDSCRISRDQHWNDLMDVKNKLNIGGDYSKTVLMGELDKLIGYEDAVIQKDKQLSQVQQQATDLGKQLADKQTQLDQIQSEGRVLASKVEDQDKLIYTLSGEITDAQNQIEQLKKDSKPPVLKGWKLSIYNLLLKN